MQLATIAMFGPLLMLKRQTAQFGARHHAATELAIGLDNVRWKCESLGVRISG